MRTSFSTLSALFFSLFLCQNIAAQSQSPSLEELQRRMSELRRQMMEQLQNSPFNDPDFATPRWDTTFHFRFDTTFEGGNMSHFFHFSPFGSDSTAQGDFFGFDRLFDRFFNFENPFGQPGESDRYDFPTDDGNQTEEGADGLLPEERLRRQEEQDKSKSDRPNTQPETPKPQRKIKTIRI